MRPEWLFHLKKRILLGLLGIFALSVLVTLAFIGVILREHLLNLGKDRAYELSRVIETSLKKLMLIGRAEVLQEAIEGLDQRDIRGIFIIDRSGKVAYASDRSAVGRIFNRYADPACVGCHTAGQAPRDASLVITTDAGQIHRIISVISNDKPCHGCHPSSQRINGKLIIDRSLRDTNALIFKVFLILAGSAAVCIAFICFFISRILSRGLDKYIDEILRQNSELSLLCSMIERLSKTIDIDELKQVVIGIFRDVLDPDEIDVVMRKDARELRCTSWDRGTGICQRKKVEPESALAAAIDAWQRGSLAAGGPHPHEFYISVEKNGGLLALIKLTRLGTEFDPLRLKMVGVVVNHVSVAFEKATLYYLAITDELTHLYTIRHFRACLEREFALSAQPGFRMALFMIDIDNFKDINDTYGHPVGDAVIENVARCLLRSLRDNDLAFRYGGEEFAVILPGTDGGEGFAIAERLRAAIEEMVADERHAALRITVSIGVASFPDHADSNPDLIAVADSALYEAKRTGKNRVVLAGKGEGSPN